MIKIGLIGLGKTGKIIAESIFKDKRFELVFAVKKTPPKPEDYEYSVETKEMLFELIKKFKPDIITDFTTPEATLENIKHLKRGTGIVVATTGFTNKQLNQLKRHKSKLKILYAPNISDGINILMKACKVIGRLWKEADIEVIDEHFKTKKDAPSGTALKISQLLNNVTKKEIGINSIRAGGIVGIHRVLFATQNQKIVIEHQSFSREVFAQATKKAILWLNKIKRVGFYEISEVYE